MHQVCNSLRTLLPVFCPKRILHKNFGQFVHVDCWRGTKDISWMFGIFVFLHTFRLTKSLRTQTRKSFTTLGPFRSWIALMKVSATSAVKKTSQSGKPRRDLMSTLAGRLRSAMQFLFQFHRLERRSWTRQVHSLGAVPSWAQPAPRHDCCLPYLTVYYLFQQSAAHILGDLLFLTFLTQNMPMKTMRFMIPVVPLWWQLVSDEARQKKKINCSR